MKKNSRNNLRRYILASIPAACLEQGRKANSSPTQPSIENPVSSIESLLSSHKLQSKLAHHLALEIKAFAKCRLTLPFFDGFGTKAFVFNALVDEISFARKLAFRAKLIENTQPSKKTHYPSVAKSLKIKNSVPSVSSVVKKNKITSRSSGYPPNLCLRYPWYPVILSKKNKITTDWLKIRVFSPKTKISRFLPRNFCEDLRRIAKICEDLLRIACFLLRSAWFLLRSVNFFQKISKNILPTLPNRHNSHNRHPVFSPKTHIPLSANPHLDPKNEHSSPPKNSLFTCLFP